MSKRDLVFVDIDTQFDFMDKAGSLYVPGAEEIVPNLRRLIGFAKDRAVPVVASVDAHPEDDPEFAQFPSHCVRDTPGQLKIGATLMAPSVVVPESERNFALPESGELVLEKTIFSVFGNKNADRIFREMDAKKYIVFGVATDYCVKAAAMGLLERGYNVIVVEDAIKGVTAEGTSKAIEEMKSAGAEFVRTDEVLSW